MKLVLLLSAVAATLTGCEQCMALTDHHFDYLYLIQQNVCGGEMECERGLRDLTFRYFGRYGGVKICEESEGQDCGQLRLSTCSDLVGDLCAGRRLDPRKPEITIEDDAEFNKILHLRGSLKRLNSEVSEIQHQLTAEIAQERAKYQSLLDRLSSLQDLS